MSDLDGVDVLVVDDEPRYLKLIRYNLESVGHRVTCLATGQEAVQSVALNPPDLVVLDLRLPGMDGFEVCQQIREFSTVPIIMLTALGAEQDKVRGLRLGADDYVTKPFSAQELLARVEAVLRRSRLSDVPTTQPNFTCEGVTIDFSARRVTVRGEEAKLTPTEYRLLHCLAANAGRVMTHEELLEKVWGAEYRGQYEGLRMYILRLRQKIEEDPHQPRYIITRPGVGYMFAPRT